MTGNGFMKSAMTFYTYSKVKSSVQAVKPSCSAPGKKLGLGSVGEKTV